jgi:DNA recombination protein RmuC
MGFQSMAVQRYSSEVWTVLGEVRTEFHKFADALTKTQDKLQSASDELEKLVGVRTRQMVRKLDTVQNYLTDNTNGGSI